MKNVLKSGIVKALSIGLMSLACLAAFGSPAKAAMSVGGIPGLLSSSIPTVSDAKNALHNIKKYRDNMMTMQIVTGMKKLKPEFQRKVILDCIANANSSILFHMKSDPMLAAMAKKELEPVEKLVKSTKILSASDLTFIATEAAETIVYLDAMSTTLIAGIGALAAGEEVLSWMTLGIW